MLFLRQIIHPDPAHDTINLRREWGSVLLMALPWAALVLFYRSHRRHCRSHPDYQSSIPAALRALLDQNRMAQTRQKWVAGLWLLMMLLMPVIVYQLRATGKAGDEILLPALVLLPLLMLVIFLGMFWYHRRHLRPGQHRLESLLASYAGTTEDSAPS